MQKGDRFVRVAAKTKGKNRRAPLLAAIDLGTNNCRLLIVEAAEQGHRFRVVDSFSRVVRLGEGVAGTGQLSEAAMARTLTALKICARRLKRHGVISLRAIATAACRRAANARELVARAEAEAGIRLEIVSEAEEARLAALGCAPLLGEAYQGALVFDIGGGSTEIIWLSRSEAAVATLYSASVPLGVVSLSEAGGGYEEMLRMVMPVFARVAREMYAAAGPFPIGTHHLLGTSGTVTTLAALALALPRYDRRKVDGSWHDSAALLDVAESLAALSADERRLLACVGPPRAELMPAGCAAFAAIGAHWPCAKLRVADRGLREGILRELMERQPA